MILFIIGFLIGVVSCSLYSNLAHYKKQYNDFMSLKNSVIDVHPNISNFRAFYDAIVIVYIRKKEQFFQSLFGTVKKRIRNIHDIHYYHNSVRYIIPIVINRGPKQTYRFYTNEARESEARESERIEITNYIQPYLGANNDFHKLQLTPADFGLEYLIVEPGNIMFMTNEIIKLNN